ncbi:MAG: hypothetical protein ACP5TH_06330 [Fervidicoccaceae archaeon]
MDKQLKKKVVEKVCRFLGLSDSELSILSRAVVSPEDLKLVEKLTSYRRFYNPDWVVRSTFEARKLYLNGKKEEALSVLGIAIHFALELISKGLRIIPIDKRDKKEISEEKIPDDAIKESFESFRLSLSYIEKNMIEEMKKKKDVSKLLGGAARLVTTMILAVITPPPVELREIARECKKIKDEVEKSPLVKNYSRNITFISFSIPFGLFILAYFNIPLAVLYIVAGSIFLGTIMKKRQNIIKRMILGKKKECSLYDERGAELLLYP